MTTKLSFSELLERSKSEKIAVHTATEKQAKELLKALDKRGYEWTLGVKLTTQTNYEVKKENTCYSFRDRYEKLRYKEVWYCSLSFYQKYGYTIIEFSDIDFKEKKQMTTKLSFSELLERTKTEEIAIHTPTEKQAKALLKALDERGYEWTLIVKLTTKTCYKYYKENTCYSFYDSYGKLRDKEVWYCSLDWYQDEGYKIIEFSEIDFEEE